MHQPKLTVVIPTYNRASQLRKTLVRLKPQLDKRWRLMVLDNHSNEPMRGVAEEVGVLGANNVSIVRNIANVGLAGNILRAFEVASTEWLVVLGDDDEISENYVDSILATIERFPTATFINFASTLYQRPELFLTDGLEKFVEQMDNWSNILFISCSAFNRGRLLPHLRFGYMYSYTMAPHIAVLLRCLSAEGGVAVFSDSNLVRYQDAESSTWPRLFLSNLVLLLELLPTRGLQEHFFRKMEPYFVPLRESADQFIQMATRNEEDYRFHFYLRRSLANATRRWTSRNARAVVLEALVSTPRLGVLFFQFVNRWRKTKQPKLSDDLQAGI